MWGTTVIKARSKSPNATLRTSPGRTFSTMPRSSIHTSPRTGVIFLGVKHGEESVCGVSGLVVVQRPRIKRYGAAEELCGKHPLLFGWKSVKGLEKLYCLTAHDFTIAPEITGLQGARRNSSCVTP